MRKITVPRNPWDIQLGDGAALDDGVVLLATGDRTGSPRIRLGSLVYINRLTMIDASHSIEIGDNTMIGPHCYITDHDHGHAGGALVNSQPLISEPVRIGRDAWIGAGAIILKGVEVGNGAIVGAGAVVTRSVPSGAKVAGPAAHQIGVR